MIHVIKLALKLFIIAAVTTALLVVTYMATLEPIANQNRLTQERLMRALLAQAVDFEEIPVEQTGSIVRVFEASNEDGAIGYIVELSPVGYAGRISMIVGISTEDNSLAGIRVLRHTETPGLGALIVTERFFSRYEGRELAPLRVVRSGAGGNEIDAITSATITTVAVTDAVNEAIKWYQESGLR